jgi:excisionase family DNA binding protein
MPHGQTTMQLRTGEAAARLGVSSERIRQLVASGALKSTSTPLGKLFDSSDVDQLREMRRQRRSDVLQFAGADRPGVA